MHQRCCAERCECVARMPSAGLSGRATLPHACHRNRVRRSAVAVVVVPEAAEVIAEEEPGGAAPDAEAAPPVPVTKVQAVSALIPKIS